MTPCFWRSRRLITSTRMSSWLDQPRGPLQRRQARQRSPNPLQKPKPIRRPKLAWDVASRLAFTRIHPLEVREVLIVSASRRDPARVDVRSRVGVRKALKSEIAWRLLPRRAVAVERLGEKVHRIPSTRNGAVRWPRAFRLDPGTCSLGYVELPAIFRKRRKRRGSMSLSLLTACWNGSATSRGRSIPTHGRRSRLIIPPCIESVRIEQLRSACFVLMQSKTQASSPSRGRFHYRNQFGACPRTHSGLMTKSVVNRHIACIKLCYDFRPCITQHRHRQTRY